MMAKDDVVHVDMVETFRLLRAERERDLIILRIETQDGKAFNFGLNLKHMAHTARVWAFDLGAIESAIETAHRCPENRSARRTRKRVKSFSRSVQKG
jgi:hypothetical protein